MRSRMSHSLYRATLASCPYLAGDWFEGQDHDTGDLAHIVDLEAGCGPVSNQNIGEEKLVLISDEDALVLCCL